MKTSLLKFHYLVLAISFSASAAMAQNFGNSLWFDGADDRVMVGNTNHLLEPVNLTFEAWFKKDRINSPSGKDRLMISVASNGWGVGFNATNKMFFTKVGVSERGSTLAIADTLWHHVAVTHDGVNVIFYIDGQLDSQQAYGVTFSSTGSYTIGSRNANEFFQGNIDEIRVWNVILTQQQIQAGMCSNLSGSETGLISYYKFDETTGSVLNDFTSNANNGTLTNMDPVSSWTLSEVPCPASGIKTGTADMDFSFSPNPFSSSAKITLPAKTKNLSLIIYDVLGNAVRRNKIQDDAREFIIPKGDLPEGIYFLQIADGKNISYNQKISVQ